ncbi:MMPL family transporter [Vibrio sinaloensis]|uniref:MMPL family transporter n=1 Tax=Photobacterium sp. (strain ATCC 43367) TaxID=379097 RepID=UPI0035E90FC4
MQSSNNSASKQPIQARTIAGVWFALVLTFVALLSQQWLFASSAPIETNILKLLPKNQQDPIAERAFEAVSTSMSDKLVFVVTTQERENLHLAADALAESLNHTGLFSQVTGRIDEGQQKQWAQYYYQHRFQQLTDEQRQTLTQHPQSQIQKVIQALYNPFSGVTGQELSGDPFLLFRDYLAQVSQQSSAFALNNGYLTAKNEGAEYVLITATLKESPYSFAAQRGVADISAVEQTLASQYQADIWHTGVLFYAQFGSESAKSEISTIGLFSLLGVVALLIIVFRSVVPLALALLSISVGLLAALSITTWLFGTVHLFSLVFGASLIGVSIDYAFHYLTERLAEGEKWHSQRALQHIFAAITMGLLTSLIGYLGMLIAPFPGLQQLALFSSIGLIAAYITVVAWYPLLAAKPSPNRKLPNQILLQRWLALWAKPRIRTLLPICCLLLSAYPLSQLRYDDDIRQLQAMPEQLKQQEDFIAQLSGVRSSQQMLVVTAGSDEALMQKLESLETPLAAWQQQGLISGYQNLAQYLSSKATQQADFELIDALYNQHGATLVNQLKLTQPPKLNASFKPVSLQDYLSEQVSEPVRFLYVGQVNDQVASVVVLNELTQTQRVKDFAEQDTDIRYLNKAEEISTLFAQYRVKVMELLALAVVAISVLLAKRYGLTHTVRIVLPSVIACIAGLATASALGSTLNLFNLLALILIIGIGIDYTLFFAEKAHSQSTLLAITLSAITTLLSFGLLALSQTHAIHSFGITVLSGIFIAWLLSPIAIKSASETQR